MNNIIRWQPFMDMDQWFDGMVPDRLRPALGFTPALDVYQTADGVVVKSSLAGVDPEKVQISIENDLLTIQGSVEQKTEVEEKDYYRKEIRSGSFHRSVALPIAVRGEEAKAEFENGMLTISIPKQTHAKPTTVRIDVKK